MDGAVPTPSADKKCNAHFKENEKKISVNCSPIQHCMCTLPSNSHKNPITQASLSLKKKHPSHEN